MKKLKIFYFLLLITFFVISNLYPQVTDYEGHTYKTVVIGGREWMAENLNTSFFSNGDSIPNPYAGERYKVHIYKKWEYYDHEPDNGRIYGKLYNWLAVNDDRGLAPEGWHIPTDAEWKELEDSLGGYLVAGQLLKSNNIWEPNFSFPQNPYRFDALPGGTISEYHGSTGLGEYGCYWSSTPGNNEDAWGRVIYNDNTDLFRNYFPQSNLMSIRCVKDDDHLVEINNVKFNIEYSEEQDKGFLEYVKKQEEFIWKNKIKSRQFKDFKEYFDVNGQIIRWEFGDKDIWGIVYFKKGPGNKQYIKVFDKALENSKFTENEKEFHPIYKGTYMNKFWPYRESAVESDYRFVGDKIDIEFTSLFDQHSYSIYTYNEYDDIDKIFTYEVDYQYSSPDSKEDPDPFHPYSVKDPNMNKRDKSIDEKIKVPLYNIKNPDVKPELISIEKYFYENNKLVKIVNTYTKDNNSYITEIKYNDHGLDDRYIYEYYE